MGDQFERVYTVTDYYDGPREGIADLNGVPHLYRSLYLEGPSEYDPDDDLFELGPVPSDLLDLALEAWAIFRRWELAFHSGEVGLETHPALPADRTRHEQIVAALAGRLRADPNDRLILRAEFRARDGEPALPRGVMRSLEVRWKALG